MIRHEASLDVAVVRRWIDLAAADFRRNREFLTQLDAAIGDADHGVNMDRGFTAAVDVLQPTLRSTPGEVLEQVGGTLILRVGGAAGPLFGTAMRRMGDVMNDADGSAGEVVMWALRAGLEGIQHLGAAVEGDKTIVDAYAPALAALDRDLRRGDDLATAARNAASVAEGAARATTPMLARKGRASYLGTRSVGHQDPGATSTALLLGALAEALAESPAKALDGPP